MGRRGEGRRGQETRDRKGNINGTTQVLMYACGISILIRVTKGDRDMAAGGAFPVVDLAPFFTEDDSGGRAHATEAVLEACRTHGCFSVVNHGPSSWRARSSCRPRFSRCRSTRRSGPGRPRGPWRPSRLATLRSRRTRPTSSRPYWCLIRSSGSTSTPLSQPDSGQSKYICNSKVRHRFLNLFEYIILVPKFVNRSFISSNLFGCVMPVPKFINHLFRSPNLSSRVIQVPKFDF